MYKKWNNPGAGTEYSGLYFSWRDMHRRSKDNAGYNPTYSDVVVCERWLSYDNFFEDMSNTWFKGATLDKDSILPGNRVYCKEYCKWMTRSENSKERNQRCIHPSKINPAMKGKTGDKHPASKKVKCIETGEVFNSAIEAANAKGWSFSSISRVCSGYRKTIKNTHWIYVETKNG